MSRSPVYQRPSSAEWSYWESELEWKSRFHVEFPTDVLKASYDFVVIGGGFTGLSTAYHAS